MSNEVLGAEEESAEKARERADYLRSFDPKIEEHLVLKSGDVKHTDILKELKAVKSLELGADCGEEELDLIRFFPELTGLDLQEAKYIKDLSVLKDCCPNLQWIHLPYRVDIDDISILKDKPALDIIATPFCAAHLHGGQSAGTPESVQQLIEHYPALVKMLENCPWVDVKGEYNEKEYRDHQDIKDMILDSKENLALAIIDGDQEGIADAKQVLLDYYEEGRKKDLPVSTKQLVARDMEAMQSAWAKYRMGSLSNKWSQQVSRPSKGEDVSDSLRFL